MIASLLQQTKQKASEHVTILSRLACAITTDKHITLLYEEASTLLLQGSSQKIQGYFILNRLLARDVSSIEGRLCSVIDRLPTLLLHATDAEGDSLCTFVDNLAQHETFMHRLEKQLARLVQSTLRRLEDSTIAYAFLLVLLRHFGKATVMSSHGNKLQRMLQSQLLHPVNAVVASHALASMYAYTSSDNWNTAWNRHVHDILHSLSFLCLSSATPANSSFSFSEQLQSHRGVSRVLLLELTLKASTLVLMQMLSVGCRSGVVVTNYTLLPSALKTILTRHCVVTDDSKNLIENEAGIAPASLSLILPHLKIYAWSLFVSLLESQHMAFKRFSYELCKCIASAFAQPDAISVDGLALKAFETAMMNFPLTMIQVGSNAIEIVVDNLEKVVENLTGLGRHTNTSLSRSVLNANTTLLQCASPLLPLPLRTRIEQSYTRLLLCVLKGLVLRERPVEVLRSDAVMQMEVFRAAAIEAQALNKDGLISGNIGLFRHAATVYCGPYKNEVSSLLACVNAMIHPAAVCIPSCNIAQVVQHAILKRKRESDEMEFVEALHSEVVDEDRDAEVSPVLSQVMTEPASSSTAKTTHDISATVKNFQYKEVKPAKIAKKSDEESDDDFDMPEINIDAKPDKE